MPLLPLLGGVALGLGQNWLNNKNVEKQEGRAKEWWYEQFHTVNQYNSPLEQRRRMEAAGFNPNLMYGQGQVMNTASTPPTTMGSKKEAPQIGEYLTQFQALRNNDITVGNDVRRVELEAQKQSFTNANTMADTAGKLLQNAKTEKELAIYSDALQTSLDFQKRNMKNAELETYKREIENANLTERIKSELKLLSANVVNVEQTTAESRARVGKMSHEIDAIKQNIKTAKSVEQRNQLLDQLTRAQKQTEYNRAETEKERAINIWIDNKLKESQIDLNQANEIRAIFGTATDVIRTGGELMKK